MVTVREVLTNLKGLLDKYYLRGDGSNLKNSNNSIVKNGIVCTDESTGKIIPKSQLSADKIADLTSYIQGTSINGDKIVDNTISSDKLKNGSVTNEKLKPTEILETGELDLDKYKTQGFYYCPSDYTVGKMSHTPWQVNPPSSGNGVGSAFSLVVLKTTGTYVRQLLFNYQNNDVEVFSRNFSGSWTPTTSGVNGWIKLSVDGHTHDYISDSTGSVTSDHIKDKTIVNGDIADTTIEEGKIKDNAITEDKIKNGAVTSDKINNGAVTEVKINNDAVTSDKIKKWAITTDKIANKNITTEKLENCSVTANQIATSCITLEKLNNSVIDNTIGGTDGSNKLITSNAVKNHVHGNLSNDGKINKDIYLNNNLVGESYNKLVVTDNNNKLRTSTEVWASYVKHDGVLDNLVESIVNPSLNNVLSSIDEKIGKLETPDKWYSYSNDSFTFNSSSWTGSISIVYNPRISYARIHFSLTNTPLTKTKTSAKLITIGNDNNTTLISTALRPRVQETGVVHSQGDVFANIEANGDITLINNSGGAVSQVHGILLYRFKDAYNVIKNKFIDGTLTDL